MMMSYTKSQIPRNDSESQPQDVPDTGAYVQQQQHEQPDTSRRRFGENEGKKKVGKEGKKGGKK